jgi:hypothetical protein
VATCSYLMPHGGRCRAAPMKGQAWCYVHHPDLEAKRQEASRRGGRRAGRGRPAAGVAEIAEIKSAIRGVIDGVAAGTVENGAILFMGYNTLLRAVEVGRKVKDQDELDARIAELEGYASKRDGRGQAWRA